jgi:hypothetical protein
MKKEFKEKMDGLVNQKVANELKEKVDFIKSDFRFEGFEDEDIFEYLCELIKNPDIRGI